MNYGKIIDEAVKIAQKIARVNGLNISDLVAHPGDDLTYKLQWVDGNIATVWISADKSPTGKEIKKVFPFDELFDPNVACKLALIKKAEITGKLLVVDEENIASN